MPDVFAQLVKSSQALTSTRDPSFGPSHVDPQLKESVLAVIDAAGGEHNEVVRDLIRRVFPAAVRHIENNTYGSDWLKSWLKARRVAHIDVLRLYLERQATAGLSAFTDAERAFPLLSDRDAFAAFLGSIETDRLEDVIASLETFEGSYPADAVVPASIVLLSLTGTLPERQRGPFSLDSRLVIARVVLRLLRQLPGPDEVRSAVDEILSELQSLTAQLELVTLVARENGDSDNPQVTEAEGARLRKELASRVRAAGAEVLAREADVTRLLLAAKRWGDTPATEPQDFTNEPEIVVRLLLESRNAVQSWAMGNRAVNTSIRLSWDTLVDIFGDEERLSAAIDTVRSRAEEDQTLRETLDLADRYLSGWRPERF